MVGGFWTEYYSTLFKGLTITSLKVRYESRSLINNLRKADHILYKSLWEDVEKNHRVTHAIKTEEKLLKELRISAERAYAIAFNVSTEERQLLTIVEKILKELQLLSQSAQEAPELRKLHRELAFEIFNALKKAQKLERDEFKQVMLIINESEEENTNLFMANIRLRMQTEKAQTILAKFAIRSEQRVIKADISKIEEIVRTLQAVRMDLTMRAKGKLKDSLGKAINELRVAIIKIKKYLNEAFTELFYIMHRDTLLTLKVLLDLNNLKKYNERWVGKHFMPQEPLQKKQEEINKIEAQISNHFHIIAQAFRILIAKIAQIEKGAEREIA